VGDDGDHPVEVRVVSGADQYAALLQLSRGMHCLFRKNQRETQLVNQLQLLQRLNGMEGPQVDAHS
jgi:hypothetical protein